jgi:uroporphyrinogen-III decarboxylase
MVWYLGTTLRHLADSSASGPASMEYREFFFFLTKTYVQEVPKVSEPARHVTEIIHIGTSNNNMCSPCRQI